MGTYVWEDLACWLRACALDQADLDSNLGSTTYSVIITTASTETKIITVSTQKSIWMMHLKALAQNTF